MPVKTITIDMEAYEILADLKVNDESFSSVIKRHFQKRKRMEDFERAVQENPIPEEVLDAMEEGMGLFRKSGLREVES